MYFLNFFIFFKKHLILMIIWFFLLIMIFYSIIIRSIRSKFEVSCHKLVLLINKKNAIIIDVRDQNEYNSGYIVDSVNIPFLNIKDDAVFSSRKFKDKPLIIVGNPMKSLYLTRKYLNNLGFLEVYVLKGGINSWKTHDLPLLSKDKLDH